MKPGAVRRLAAAAALGATFILVATLNCGGYRYGVGDQAFYIPAILLDIDPALFPRDRALIEAQDPLMAFDEVLAGVAAATGISLPVLFLGLYVAGLALLAWAAARLGRVLAFSAATTVAFLALLTLKHRITETGVNTLEGYLHPRMLAFAVGAAATSLVVTGRIVTALLLAFGAMVVHPTTGFWFVLLVTAAAIATDARARRPLLGAIALAGLVGGVVGISSGLLADRLVIMDEAWIRLLERRDYIFPDAWGPEPWIANIGTLGAAAAIYQYRAAAGHAMPRERGVLVGLLCLVLVFILSVPLIAARVALAVQLQTSRVFWLADFMAMAYVAWLVTDSPHMRRLAVRARRLPWIVAGVLIAAALSRGGYVTYFEHENRGAFAVDLPDDEWTDVMRWLRTRPVDAHVLADPGHSWRYGSSVRVAGRRDVLLEEQKDGAIAIYSRDVATRVLDRIDAIGSFDELTAARARDLANRYDVQLLIAEKPVSLPIMYKNTRFSVYDLVAAVRNAHDGVTPDTGR